MGGFAKLKPHIQILVVVGVCAALLGAVWYWFLSPIEAEIETQKGRLAELETTVAKAMARKAALDQFRKDAERLRIELEEIRKVLPQARETAQLLDQVQASAMAAGLRIQNAVFRPIVDHEVYTETPLEMEVVGTYHNLGKYLEMIRSLSRIVNVGKLRIETRAADGPNAYTGSVGATYEAATFVYREEIADAAPAAGPAKGGRK